MKLCFEAGLENFIFEVVTDKLIGVGDRTRVRELVVPTSYWSVFFLSILFKKFLVQKLARNLKLEPYNIV